MLRFPKDFLTTREQKALLFVCAFGLFGMLLSGLTGTHSGGQIKGKPAQELEASIKEDKVPQIDIRTANLEELMQLPGIGEKRAQDIIDYRAESGFNSVRDLLNIKGIGEKTLAKMQPSLVPISEADGALAQQAQTDIVQDTEAGNKTKSPPGKASSTQSVSKGELTNMVNINSAGIEELCTLPGIGKVKAQAIIDYRTQNGAFQSIEGITQVKGIGTKTLEKIRNRLSI